jgi:hypothetical protein
MVRYVKCIGQCEVAIFTEEAWYESSGVAGAV